MGCDIHAHAEYKINNRWEHVKEVSINRNYQLFSLLVHDHPRSNGQKGIAKARGLPADVNPFTEMVLNNDDNHTHSYLLGEELMKLYDYHSDDNYSFLGECEYDYVFDHQVIASNDFRIVFAFDN
jgi:hypothetical protein